MKDDKDTTTTAVDDKLFHLNDDESWVFVVKESSMISFQDENETLKEDSFQVSYIQLNALIIILMKKINEQISVAKIRVKSEMFFKLCQKWYILL